MPSGFCPACGAPVLVTSPWDKHRVYHHNACWIAAWRDRQAARQGTLLPCRRTGGQPSGHAASRCPRRANGAGENARDGRAGLDPAPSLRQVWLRRMMVRVRWRPGGTALV
jgi:hypothetical protein